MNIKFFNKIKLNTISLNKVGEVLRKVREIVQEYWDELVLQGINELRIQDAKEDSISSLIVNGGASQSATPTPTAPVSFKTNRGEMIVKDSELPVGYARLTGIVYNDDTYYTISGFRLRGSDTVRITFKADKACNLFGCYTTASAQDNYSVFLSTSSNAKYMRYNGGTYLSEIVPNQKYSIEVTPTGCTGFASKTSWTQKDFEASVDMLIGNTSVNATSAKMDGIIYGNIEVVGRALFIPCKRVSDGVVGYYDTYSKTFYEPTIGAPTSLGSDTSHIEMTLSAEDTITTRSKNLNEGILSHNGYSSTGDESVSNTFCGTLCKIRVKEKQKYTVSYGGFTEEPNGVFINTWLEDGTWNRRQAIAAKGVLNYTIPAGVGYANFTVYRTGELPISEDSWMQVELGAEASEYVPYDLYSTSQAENLLSVGSYTDTQDIISGSVTRKVGVKVFDGTESSWAKGSNTNADGNAVFYVTIDDRANNDTSLKLLSSHYSFRGTVSYSTLKADEMSITQTTKNVYFDGAGITTLADWKAYLAEQYANGTPVVIVYPLATEVVENVTPQKLTNPKGDFSIFRMAGLADLDMSATLMVKGEAPAPEPEQPDSGVIEYHFDIPMYLENVLGVGETPESIGQFVNVCGTVEGDFTELLSKLKALSNEYEGNLTEDIILERTNITVNGYRMTTLYYYDKSQSWTGEEAADFVNESLDTNHNCANGIQIHPTYVSMEMYSMLFPNYPNWK